MLAGRGRCGPANASTGRRSRRSRTNPARATRLPVNGWKTRLHLSLPNLGHVTASLRLDSSRVEVQITVKDWETASIMRTGAAPLLHGLASAGLKLTSMGVDVDDEVRSA